LRVWRLLDDEGTVQGLARRLAPEAGMGTVHAELLTAAVVERLTAIGLVWLEPSDDSRSQPARG